MICAVVLAKSLDELREQGILALKQGADLVECRLDGLESIDFVSLEEFLDENRERPIIFSIRSEWNSEVIEPPLDGRRENMKRLIALKPKYIDLEYPIDMSLLSKVHKSTTPVLASLDFTGMARVDIDALIRIVKSYDREIIVKVSTHPNSVSDLKTIWRWAKEFRKHNIRYVVVGMGLLGQLTRIKAKEIGSQWMYGRFSSVEGEPFLPGMLNIEELSSAFANNSWHLANLGNLPENDILRQIYLRLIERTKINGTYVNLPVATSPELDQMLLWVEDGLLDGLNISSPWQVEILNRLDVKDASAIIMGSVNCVAITKEGLKGYNTQISALRRSLEPFSFKRINRVYIDGTERVANAIIHVLEDKVETIVLRDEMFSNPHPIFDTYPHIIPSKENYSDEFDLVVNCNTPAKGFENVVMMPKTVIEGANIIFDPMSKLSEKTALMREAEKLGKNYIGGFQFFFNTALTSFEIWTKKSIPPSMLNVEMFNDFSHKIDFGFMLNY